MTLTVSARAHKLEPSRRMVRFFKQLFYAIFTICSRAWCIAWRAGLRLVLGKQLLNKMLQSRHQVCDVVEYLPLRLRNRVFHPERLIDGFVAKKSPDGILIMPHGGCPMIYHEIYSRKVYNRVREIQKDDVVIDVGAHIGVFTLRAARRAVEGLVIAVEPHPLNYRLLMENVKRNNLKNVVALNLALSNYNGTANLYESVFSGLHSLVTRKGKFVRVPVKTLDRMVEELRIVKIDVIKIDVEGGELDVLKGAEKTLKRNHIHLAIAAYHTRTEAQELSAFLLDRNFKIAKSKYIDKNPHFPLRPREQIYIDAWKT